MSVEQQNKRMNQKELELYKNWVDDVAQMSTAVRLKVGAIALDEHDDMICYGYNGTMRGDDNCCEYENELGELVTLDSVIHAEQNVITHAARRGSSLRNATIVATHSPCMKCATLLVQSGVKRYYYKNAYRTFTEVFEKTKNRIEYIKL